MHILGLHVLQAYCFVSDLPEDGLWWPKHVGIASQNNKQDLLSGTQVLCHEGVWTGDNHGQMNFMNSETRVNADQHPQFLQCFVLQRTGSLSIHDIRLKIIA
jgi:hypothetical protein